MSLASDQAEESAKRANAPDYYNLGIGPIKLRFEGKTGVEFNDNVNYTEVNRQSDIILSPGIETQALWPITQQNTLGLSIAAGYNDYIKETSLSQMYISPNSGLVFKVYTGDFVINLHDRFSLTEDVAQNPTISGTGNFGQLENTAGVGVDWDLYKLILSFEYDYDLSKATTAQFSYVDHGSELFNLRATLLLHETTKLGLQLGGGITSLRPADSEQQHRHQHWTVLCGAAQRTFQRPIIRRLCFIHVLPQQFSQRHCQ